MIKTLARSLREHKKGSLGAPSIRKVPQGGSVS